MKREEALEQIENKEFLDRIYHFSYHRCDTSFEAEDLCAEILLEILSALGRQEEIVNLNGFVWKIAHRVYADFCEKRKKRRSVSGTEDLEEREAILLFEGSRADPVLAKIVAEEELKKVFDEIAFLSKAYRDVMVMYYLEERKTRDIAAVLGISETTVKQRLFVARDRVRKEVKAMDNRCLSLKPIKMDFIGTGNPDGTTDPYTRAERTLSKNLIYLCHQKPRTPKELSEELCVPMLYIEEEIEILCGEEGSYGFLRSLGNGRYVNNILVADQREYVKANQIYEKYLPEFYAALKSLVEQKREQILSFPFLSPRKDLGFIMWAMIARVFWGIQDGVNQAMKEKFFPDSVPVKRAFSYVGVAFQGKSRPGQTLGINGAYAMEVAGYRDVYVENLFGKGMEAHFYCDHNLSRDEKLLMLLRSVKGLTADELTEEEKEIAAKAIACGYIFREGKNLVPKILVIDKENGISFFGLGLELGRSMQGIVEQVAKELGAFMEKRIPPHLKDEYPLYQLIAGDRILSKIVSECITEGILSKPEAHCNAEGVIMLVGK